MAIITNVKNRLNQLDQASFQILCDAYLSKIGYPNLVALGTKEGAQKTTPGTPDTYFTLLCGKYVFAEYTTQKSNLFSKIKGDIEKCLDEDLIGVPLNLISEIVYCHLSSNLKPEQDMVLRERCETLGIKLTIIGIDLLAEGLMKYPSIIKDHLNISVDTEQIQLIDDFVKQYDSNPLVATLATDFIPRKREFHSISTAFEVARVVLLSGVAGVGKTRLAIEYAKMHSKEHNETLYCIHDRSLALYNDLVMYFEEPGKYFVVIDDANQLSELQHVVELANQYNKGIFVNILITVRDYALQKVLADICGLSKYEVVSVGCFSDDEIKALVSGHYGITNQHYLERIADIAEGNARIAMLSGKVACDSNSIESIKDVTELYADYYGKVITDAELNSNEGLLITAGIMAFLNAIHLDHIEAIQPILEEERITVESFISNIKKLHENEIIDICNDKGVHFSEQCLANYILKYVFYDRKMIKLSLMIEACFSTYKERTIHAINTLYRCFQNADLHKYVKGEILCLWHKLEETKSSYFYDYVKAFYPLNPVETLQLMKRKIDEVNPVVMLAERIDVSADRNSQSVDDDIIKILGGYADTEDFESALDLFFLYYLKRPDLYIQFFHATILYFGIHRDSYISDYYTQQKFFQRITDVSNGWTNPFILLLFTDISKEFLKLEFSHCESGRNEKSVTFYRVAINCSNGVCKYRQMIWEQLIHLSNCESNWESISRILQHYGNAQADCSKDVIRFDARFIFKLVNSTLAADKLSDCRIVESLNETLKDADISTDEFEPFLKNEKMFIYHLLIGPNRGDNLSFDERETKKSESVINYIASSDNKIDAFITAFEIYKQLLYQDNVNKYEISTSINLMLNELSQYQSLFLMAAKIVIEADLIEGINLLFVVRTLFAYVPKEKVLELLSICKDENRNVCKYSYYKELPEEMIDYSEVEGLYDFLYEESDGTLTSSSYRSISFVDKYYSFDSDVFLKAVRIVFEKRRYSAYIAIIYLHPLFIDCHNTPSELIGRFKTDLSLLEEVYLFLDEEIQSFDFYGSIIYEIYKADNSFAQKYVEEIAKNNNSNAYENAGKFKAFYEDNNCNEVISNIINSYIQCTACPSIKTPYFIKGLFICNDGSRINERCDQWVKYYISAYNNCGLKMRYLFEAIAEQSMELIPQYVAFFISLNDNFDLFKSLPLIPLSASWSGSAVPMYTKWKKQIEKLLPLFTGLKFIEHKKHVEAILDSIDKKIESEEIADILRG